MAAPRGLGGMVEGSGACLSLQRWGGGHGAGAVGLFRWVWEEEGRAKQ